MKHTGDLAAFKTSAVEQSALWIAAAKATYEGDDHQESTTRATVVAFDSLVLRRLSYHPIVRSTGAFASGAENLDQNIQAVHLAIFEVTFGDETQPIPGR